MNTNFEFLLIGKDGLLYALVDSKTGETRELTLPEKIKLRELLAL